MDIDDEAAELCVQPRLHEAEKAVRAELPGYAIAKKGIQDDGVIAVLIGIQELLAIGDMTVHLVGQRSEEHTSELQSLMRISYAVFCLKKKIKKKAKTKR